MKYCWECCKIIEDSQAKCSYLIDGGNHYPIWYCETCSQRLVHLEVLGQKYLEWKNYNDIQDIINKQIVKTL